MSQTCGLQVSQVIGTEPILGVAGVSWLELRVLDSGESGLVDEESFRVGNISFRFPRTNCFMQSNMLSVLGSLRPSEKLILLYYHNSVSANQKRRRFHNVHLPQTRDPLAAAAAAVMQCNGGAPMGRRPRVAAAAAAAAAGRQAGAECGRCCLLGCGSSVR